MDDLFDYMFLYYLSLLLAVLKIAGFITWAWWIIALPIFIAFALFVIVTIASR